MIRFWLLYCVIVLKIGDDILFSCEDFFSKYEVLHGIPEGLLQAIALTESGTFDSNLKKRTSCPFALNVNGMGVFKKSKTEAVHYLTKLRKKGIQSIDVGCMQINLKYHPNAFSSYEAAFDPEKNVAYAASFLKSLYVNSKDWTSAIERYHSHNPFFSKGYLKRVLNNWKGREDLTLSVVPFKKPTYKEPIVFMRHVRYIDGSVFKDSQAKASGSTSPSQNPDSLVFFKLR